MMIAREFEEVERPLITVDRLSWRTRADRDGLGEVQLITLRLVQELAGHVENCGVLHQGATCW